MTKIQQTPDYLLKMINVEIDSYVLSLENLSCCEKNSLEISNAYAYPLKAGGKRIRPLLTLLTAGAFGGTKALETAKKAALAVENVHTYSLVHDDLPCMDNDDLRRGLPTTHKIYGDAKALLVGDALLTQSFSILASIPFESRKNNYTAHLVHELAEGAGANGMIWGQWLDISFTGENEVTWEQMELVHKNKTGKLLGASLVLGFICGAASLDICEKDIIEIKSKIREAGILIGLAFQIIDDILDATKSNAELGKTAGKDAKQHKTTALNLLGLNNAEKLSLVHTRKATSLLYEVFSNPIFSPRGEEEICFQNELHRQIDLLLSRQN